MRQGMWEAWSSWKSQEKGFPPLVLHQFDEHAPLWRVYVECRPEGGIMQEMGYLSVLPHDL